MLIATYGVSRSGKDYLIDNTCSYLIQKGIPLKHIKGSQELNSISQQVYGTSFKHLSDGNKILVRKQFISELRLLEQKYENIVVDGHYAFFNNDGNLFNVITEEDLHCYDVFLYLNTKSSTIIDRIQHDGSKTLFKGYSIDIVDQWKNYEIENLTNDLLKLDKELHVIQNDGVITYQYIEDIINGEHNSKFIAERIVESILSHSNSPTYLLTDCDKTLSYEDSTSLAFDKKFLDSMVLKHIYEGDNYTNYQAYLVARYCIDNSVFDDDSINYAIEQLTMNVKLIDNLRELNLPIVALSGGNNHIWDGAFHKYKLSIDFYNNKMIMSKYIKFFVVKFLQNRRKFVISFGDSIMDYLMLNSSTKGYLINTKGYRPNLKLLLERNPNIYQLSCNSYIYDTNPVDNKVTLTKTLDESNEKIESLINISKSTSGVTGTKLRQAHKEAGNKLACLIRQQSSKKYAVVIMMRSGLMLGEGIADLLDCPVLFYDEGSETKFIDEWNYINQKIEYTAIICDGVINSGKSIVNFLEKTSINRFIIATNVISTKCEMLNMWPIYATRISNNSFVGAKQKEISNGKGPDTSDRLFKTI